MCSNVAMKKRPAIPRLDGGSQTVLLVEDVERSVDFYGESLRLELRDGDTGRYAEFDTGDGGVLVLVKREGSIAPMAMDAAISSKSVALTFNVSVEEFEMWKKWFPRRGVEIERETKWIHGGRSLYVMDPDGRRLEFKTPPVIAPPKPAAAVEKKGD